MPTLVRRYPARPGNADLPLKVVRDRKCLAHGIARNLVSQPVVPDWRFRMSTNEKSHAFNAMRPSTSTSASGLGLTTFLVLVALALATILWIFSWGESPALWQDPGIIPFL
jgi:hypothetical protein